jgi:hypothetical protein
VANAEIRSSVPMNTVTESSDSSKGPVGGTVGSTSGADPTRLPAGGPESARPSLMSNDSTPNVPGRYPREI